MARAGTKVAVSPSLALDVFYMLACRNVPFTSPIVTGEYIDEQDGVPWHAAHVTDDITETTGHIIGPELRPVQLVGREACQTSQSKTSRRGRCALDEGCTGVRQTSPDAVGASC